MNPSTIHDPHGVLATDATLEHLASGSTWAEGPCWIAATGRLRWSDVVGDRILEFDPETGETGVYADGVEFVNGRTLDRAGDVVQCSHGRRRVERDAGGHVEMIVDRFKGHRFNSPNDVVVDSAGVIWFTDPPYGIHESGREGHPGEPEYGGCSVFRYDESTGDLRAVVTDMVHPNGLAFSPDEKTLYVADTGYLWNDDAPGWIRAYEVADGACSAPRVFAEVRPGAADGFRVDAAGRVWSSSRDSVQVFLPSGERIAVIPVPETVSNVCFGGPDGRDLYITATTSLYRIRTTTGPAVPGVQPRPSGPSAGGTSSPRASS
ncbi:SMP-30/gluconolactonase/LRE family protein [Leifsonia poae]|uniref:SMP-30/gluconolactonase/LRE family protein n=1 Tax=Leifsonia poae TaxID=110933 RepID=UPI001CBD5827|nr:SMP-30/gluconolactonase/LRE family protein [Leifsonia poae]